MEFVRRPKLSTTPPKVEGGMACTTAFEFNIKKTPMISVAMVTSGKLAIFTFIICTYTFSSVLQKLAPITNMKQRT